MRPAAVKLIFAPMPSRLEWPPARRMEIQPFWLPVSLRRMQARSFEVADDDVDVAVVYSRSPKVARPKRPRKLRSRCGVRRTGLFQGEVGDNDVAQAVVIEVGGDAPFCSGSEGGR